jgi:hypothetical protein
MVGGRALLVAVLVSACASLGCDSSSGGASSDDGGTQAALEGYGRAGPPPSSHPGSTRDAGSADAGMILVQHHVSLAGILLRAAYDVPLNGEQRGALDQGEAQLYPTGAATPWTSVKTFQADLVAGIRAGKIDMTKLKADEAEIDAAVAAAQAAEADELDTLHGVLDEATRQSIADVAKARRARFEGPKPPPPGGAPDAGVVDLAKRHLEKVTAELSLDDGQQKRVAVLLARQGLAAAPTVEQARRDAMRKRVDALLAAFPQDSFDAHKLDLSGPSGKAPHERLDEAATFAAGMISILNLGQRLLFADQTEHAGGHPERFLEDVDPGPPHLLDLRPHP